MYEWNGRSICNQSSKKILVQVNITHQFINERLKSSIYYGGTFSFVWKTKQTALRQKKIKILSDNNLISSLSCVAIITFGCVILLYVAWSNWNSQLI